MTHFQSVDDFRVFVENGFKEVESRVSSTGKRSDKKFISKKEMRSMKNTAQTRKEVALLKKVQRDNRLADRVVQDTKYAASMLGSRGASEVSPSKELSAEMRKRRIVQVREQEKLLAASTNRRRREIKEKIRSDVDQNARMRWQHQQLQRKQNLQMQYAKALTSIGAAQKSAITLQSGLRSRAREQLGAWHSTKEQHNELHRQAMSQERSTISPVQQLALHSEMRDRARVDEGDRQREEARRYQAVLQAASAANEFVESQRMKLDYSNMGMDRRVETAVYDHGGGATDFSRTRIHHRVVRHQRPRVSPNTLSSSSSNGRMGKNDETKVNISSRTTRQIPFVKRIGGRPRDGNGAVEARRAEYAQEIEESLRKRRLQDERAEQRYRTATNKLKMKKEYDNITKELEMMDYKKRQQRAKEVSIYNRNRLNSSGGRGKVEESRIIEDQFERMFVDERLTSIDLSGVVQVDDSQDVQLEDLQYLQGIDAIGVVGGGGAGRSSSETVYVRNMVRERKDQEMKMNAARAEQKQLLKEAKRRQLAVAEASAAAAATAFNSAPSSAVTGTTVVLPRANVTNSSLMMSNFNEGPPMDGDELEEYAMRAVERRKVAEKEFDDRLRLNASSVSIRSICLRRKLLLLLLGLLFFFFYLLSPLLLR